VTGGEGRGVAAGAVRVAAGAVRVAEEALFENLIIDVRTTAREGNILVRLLLHLVLLRILPGLEVLISHERAADAITVPRNTGGVIKGVLRKKGMEIVMKQRLVSIRIFLRR
jgi:hypothetical protein